MNSKLVSVGYFEKSGKKKVSLFIETCVDQ